MRKNNIARIKNFEDLLFPILVFLIWRIYLFLVAALAVTIVPAFGGRFPYWQERLVASGLPNWLWSWGNFDGVHYLGIAAKGYADQFTQVFFPLYPLLINFLAKISFNNLLLVGLIASNFSFLVALVVFFKLVEQEFGANIAKKASLLLLVFPTSFFFGAVYTEGLFLLLVLAAFYFAKRGNWLLASISGFFACLTKLVGIFLFPALLVEYYLQNRPIFKAGDYLKITPKLLPFLLVPAGLLTYVGYLAVTFSNPISFVSGQSVYAGQREVGKIVLLPQIIWRYLKIFANVPIRNLAFFNAAFEFVTTLSFLTLSIISLYKVRPSWAVFAIGALVLPTLTGTFASMPRYVLVAFAVFVLLAKIENRYYFWVMTLIFAVLGFVSVVLFTRGYWLA